MNENNWSVERRRAPTSVRLSVLGSGSGGNATLVATERTCLLIDAGLSRRETFRRMKSIGEEPEKLDAILISHEHTDHCAGMFSLARALNVPIYLNAFTRRAVPNEFDSVEQAKEKPATGAQRSGLLPFDGEPVKKDDSWRPVFEVFQPGRKFTIKDIEIESFTIPHDAVDPVAFCVSAEGIRIGVCTDLGYLPESIKTHLRGCHCLVLESNHDLDMLKVGPYPWAVKQRVMGRTGHLSNAAVGDFLTNDFDASAAAVLVLAHLSEQNNHPEIARLTAAMALESRGAETRLALSSQKSATEIFRF